MAQGNGEIFILLGTARLGFWFPRARDGSAPDRYRGVAGPYGNRAAGQGGPC